MQTRVYKLYANVSADTNAASQLVFQRPGLITAIFAALLLNGTADNDLGQMEISFASTRQLTTNDTIGPIFQVGVLQNLTTSGVFHGQVNQGISGLAIPVDQGVRAYLHTEITGTVNLDCAAYLYVLEGNNNA